MVSIIKVIFLQKALKKSSSQIMFVKKYVEVIIQRPYAIIDNNIIQLLVRGIGLQIICCLSWAYFPTLLCSILKTH